MLIVLYGKSNQGKTTTLMELAINLAGGGPAMDKSIKAIFNKKSKLNDVRIIIEFKDVFIYIASGGDAWSICKGNTNFFESQFSKQIIYIIDASGLRQMSSEEKISFKMKKSKPKVAICACRPNGDQFGAIKAINAPCSPPALKTLSSIIGLIYAAQHTLHHIITSIRQKNHFRRFSL